MTLILSVPTTEGIVFASDGQLTRGDVRSTAKKLFSLNPHCAWAGSGELALIQRVKEEIDQLNVNEPLALLRDHLAGKIKHCVESLLNLDFRTPFFRADHHALLSLHPGDFVFVENRQGPKILHILSNGTPEWVEQPYASGSGASFAYALLRKYEGVTLNLNQASLLAFKVIEEAIEVGAYGLGPPIDVWHILPEGIQPLSNGKIAALADASKTVRTGEIRLLLGDMSCFGEPSDETISNQGGEITSE